MSNETPQGHNDKSLDINDLTNGISIAANQADLNKIFEKEVKYVYAEIDKRSDLLWAQKDEKELIRFNNNGSRINTRKPKRGENEDALQQTDFERETNASIGYGEITRVSIHL